MIDLYENKNPDSFLKYMAFYKIDKRWYFKSYISAPERINNIGGNRVTFNNHRPFNNDFELLRTFEEDDVNLIENYPELII